MAAHPGIQQNLTTWNWGLLASRRLTVLCFDWPEGHRSLPGGLGYRHCNAWRVYCPLAGNRGRKPLMTRSVGRSADEFERR